MFLSTNLGNIGHSTATCLHQFISVDDAFHISCPKGKLSEIWHYGLMPRQKEHTISLDYCDSEIEQPEVKYCTKNALRVQELLDTYNRDCFGQQKCDFNLREFVVQGDSKMYPTWLQKEDPVSQWDGCVHFYASVYIQYACEIEDEHQIQQKKGLVIAFAGVMCIIVFRFCIYWLRVTSDIDIVEYDIATTTLVDFAV